MNNKKVQVQIFPEKLLLGKTTQKLASELSDLEAIEGILITGPRIPKKVPYGPGRGLPNPHTDRIKVEVDNKETNEVDLKVKVGKLILEINEDKEYLENVLSEIREVADKVLNCDYEIKTGNFIDSPTRT